MRRNSLANANGFELQIFVLAAEIPCEWMFATKFASDCECDGVVHSGTHVMRTARETSKTKPCETKARSFFALLPVGAQESVLKVPKRGRFHAAIHVTLTRCDSCLQGALRKRRNQPLSLGKRKHTPPCSRAELFFAGKNGFHRGKISVVDMAFLAFIGFWYPPPAWKVFLFGQKSSPKDFLSVVVVYAFFFSAQSRGRGVWNCGGKGRLSVLCNVIGDTISCDAPQGAIGQR